MKAGRELDRLVAEKVMNLIACDKWERHYGGWGMAISGAGDVWVSGCKHPSGSCYPVDAPAPYSTDITAAWQLIEKHPHYVSLTHSNDHGYTGRWNDHMTWRCRFYAPEKFEAEADTAPLAICLAALKAIGVEVDE